MCTNACCWTRAGSPNYGPRAKCGPRNRFTNDEKNIIMKNSLSWQNITYPETATLRKMSGPRHVLYYLMWPSDKKFGDPWTRVLMYEQLSYSQTWQSRGRCKFIVSQIIQRLGFNFKLISVQQHAFKRIWTTIAGLCIAELILVHSSCCTFVPQSYNGHFANIYSALKLALTVALFLQDAIYVAEDNCMRTLAL